MSAVTWTAIAVLAVLATAVQSDSPQPNSDLKLVIIMFRHGARAPEQTFPNDQCNDKWPQGLGELLISGMKMQYDLGTHLRNVFVTYWRDFMDSSYKAEEIRVISTPLNRTIMSAQSHLAGLFPPTDDQKFESSIDWQPIPVYTEPIETDPLLKYRLCPGYYNLMEADKVLPEYTAVLNDPANQELFTFLESQTGVPSVNLDNLIRIQDPIFVETANPQVCAPPTWLRSAGPGRPVSDFDRMNTVYDYVQGLTSNTLDKQKLTIAPWYKEVIANIDDYVTGVNTPDAGLPNRKVYLYAGHDATVLPALDALGLWDGVNPGYASAFAIELREEFGVYKLKFFYKQSSSVATVRLSVPSGCADLSICTLDEFKLLLKPLLDSDFETECKRTCPLSSGVATIAGVECAPLSHIANGKVHMTESGEGLVAEYSCNQGYVLVGESQRACQQFEGHVVGTVSFYTGQEPSCVSVAQVEAMGMARLARKRQLKLDANEQGAYMQGPPSHFDMYKQELAAAAAKERRRLYSNEQGPAAAEQRHRFYGNEQGSEQHQRLYSNQQGAGADETARQRARFLQALLEGTG